MSNAMSRSKSRWKGALLAAAVTAVISPLAAKAQTPTMTVELSTSATNPTPTNNYEYIAPDATVPLYVWATVTESGPVTASNVAGLQYLYFNVSANYSSGTPSGIISNVTASPLFGGGAFNLSGGVEGSQLGSVSTTPYTNAASIAVGDSSNLSNMAKPRAVGAVFSSTASPDIVVSGNTASFMVESLTYKPSFTPAATAVSGLGDEINFNVSTPTSTALNGYAGSNYFANLTAAQVAASGAGSNISIGASNTFTAYNASASSAVLIDAEAGDANLDGLVNSADFVTVGHNFGLVHGTDAGWTNGDVTQDGLVNSADFVDVGHNFGTKYGPGGGYGPVALAGSPTAEIGGAAGSSVPEPTSLGLLALGSLAVLKRRGSRA